MSVNSIEHIQLKLKQNTSKLEAFSLREIQLFGSFLTHHQTDESDIDLIVYFTKEIGYITLSSLKLFLESIFERAVDMMTESGLHPKLKTEIIEQAVPIWSGQ